MRSNTLYTIKRFLLVTAGAVLMAFDIKTFVHAGALIPGGFTGLALLIQEVCLRYGGIHVPFSIINYTLNAVPAIVCFRFIGKKFTLYSVFMIIVSSILIDWMPSMFIDFIKLHDALLAAVFGGLLNAVAIALCLHADATSGGTDFIAIFISEKYHRDAWNIIFAGNCIVLAAAGFLFSLDRALYSIIFQFATTAALGVLYRGYQQRTLIIITNSPAEVYKVILDRTNHGATSLDGFGLYEKKKRSMLYSVVTAPQVKHLIPEIRKIDPVAFINVIKTEHINGRFFQPRKD